MPRRQHMASSRRRTDTAVWRRKPASPPLRGGKMMTRRRQPVYCRTLRLTMPITGCQRQCDRVDQANPGNDRRRRTIKPGFGCVIQLISGAVQAQTSASDRTPAGLNSFFAGLFPRFHPLWFHSQDSLPVPWIRIGWTSAFPARSRDKA